MFANKPAVKILILFAVGIILGKFINLVSYITLYIGILLIILLFITYKWNRNVLFTISLGTLLIFLGFIKFYFDARYIHNNRIDNFISRSDVLIVKGRITDQPIKKTKYLQFVIDADTLITNDSLFIVSGGAQIIIPLEKIRDINRFRFGYRTTIFSGLYALRTARNPGEFDMKNYLEAYDIYARIQLDDDEKILIDSSADKSLLSIIYSLRSLIAKNIETQIGGLEATFLKGILIGDRSEIPFELKESFVNSGVVHILAVSGLHVGIITFVIIAVFNLFRLPERIRYLLTMFCLVFYIFLTGGSASVIRATIMAVILMGSFVFQRKFNIYNSIAVAALIILILDSRQIFSPGFQLSFVAVISIVVLYPKISNLKNYLPENLKQMKVLKYIIALFSVSFTSAIGTLPFTSYYFGKISIIGLVANLLIVPLMGIVLSVGVAFTVFSFISSSISSLFSEVTKLLSTILLYSVNYFGSLKYSHINSYFSLSGGLLYYFWIFYIVTIKKQKILGRIVIGMLLILNIYVFSTIFEKSNLEFLFFDVGQGDAIFIRTPENKTILIDAGMKNPNYDAAQWFIKPYLLRNNIKRLDLVINSHPHSDHLGGIPTMLRNLNVTRMIDAGSAERSDMYNEYKKLLDSLKINYVIKTRGDTIFIDDKIRLYVLNPSAKILSTSNLNNHSIVLKILYKKTSIILTGDIESEYEMELAELYKEFLKSDVFKCPHHGSNTSSSKDFIKFVNPKYAIISVGQNNKYGHPSKEVLDRLKHMDINIFRTDQHGAILFHSDGEEVWNVDWRE